MYFPNSSEGTVPNKSSLTKFRLRHDSFPSMKVLKMTELRVRKKITPSYTNLLISIIHTFPHGYIYMHIIVTFVVVYFPFSISKW